MMCLASLEEHQSLLLGSSCYPGRPQLDWTPVVATHRCTGQCHVHRRGPSVQQENTPRVCPVEVGIYSVQREILGRGELIPSEKE